MFQGIHTDSATTNLFTHALCAGFHGKDVYVLHGKQGGDPGFDTVHLERARFDPDLNKYKFAGLSEQFERSKCVHGEEIPGMVVYDAYGDELQGTAYHHDDVVYGDISMGAEVEEGAPPENKIVGRFDYDPSVGQATDIEVYFLPLTDHSATIMVTDVLSWRTIY